MNNTPQTDLSTLINRINLLCSKMGISINKMLIDCKLKKSVVDNMKKGSVPTIDKVRAIADYFGVSVDYLLGNTDERRPAPGRPIAIMGADTKHGGVRMVDTPEGAKISEIRDYLDRFTLDQLNDVLQYVKFLNSKE